MVFENYFFFFGFGYSGGGYFFAFIFSLNCSIAGRMNSSRILYVITVPIFKPSSTI